MAQNKTRETGADVTAFIEATPHEGRRADARALLEIMQRLSGEPPRMWGSSIIGFGRYRYRYDSGREGDFMRIGFSPRKTSLVLYIMPGFEEEPDLVARLGKHKTGKSCLYVNTLADVDMDVLERLIARSREIMAERYPQEEPRGTV
ncbi:MAG: DUF1801 domain-containing protein [Caulobacterales bacterium]|nr:DUF1801 domain-containing protein [Caulobacterales bacterium]